MYVLRYDIIAMWEGPIACLMLAQFLKTNQTIPYMVPIARYIFAVVKISVSVFVFIRSFQYLSSFSACL